ncbi:hypothetical protein BYT27DRAFT_7226640 [Phlegmacium glaucopus]|nr:hypothetical protein BYT27DRAFT_7226640 [Phlegmacium glaucopus]
MILVMGPSGTGKTAFIKLLTENEGIDLEYNLGGPRTCKLALSNFSIRDLCVEFIDAPSFDDSVHKSPTDTDILKTIAAFLDSAHKAGKKLHGVIFMHRISDSGVSNLTKHNLRMLQHICGSDSLKNVAIVTTMWDSVNDNAAKIREEALTSDGSFKPLLDAGARLLRHDDDFTSAYVITKRLLGKQPIQLLIQTDLDQGKSIPSTAAGPELNVLIQNLIASHQKEIRKANNYAAKKALEQERQTLRV